VTDHVAATRASYDAVAADYAELFKDQLPGHPWEKAMVTLFADLVRADGNLRVADLGCGPVHQHLGGAEGQDVFGQDVGDAPAERRFGPATGAPRSSDLDGRDGW